MAAKKKKGKHKPGYDFLIAELKKSPSADYKTLKEKADKKRLKIFPIMYGRAKHELGLVPTRSRKAKASTGKRGPGRPPKAAKGDKATNPGAFGSLVEHIHAIDRQTDALRAALLRIRDLIDDVL